MTFPKLAPQIGKLSLTTGWAWLTSILCVMLLASSLPAQAVPVDVATTPSRHEILFVESNVADYQTLLNGVKPAGEVHVLDAAQDGLAQMAEILKGRNGVDAIHVVSHGSAGAVQLGELTLTAQNLNSHAADLTAIRNALSHGGDILLYGCDVAKGSDGTKLVEALAQATQANVAASNDVTGSSDLNGNWTLEVQRGNVSARGAPFHTDQFRGLLAQQTIDLGGAVISGSLASGNFVIGGVQFVVSSASGFTVSQSGGALVITENSATGDFSVTMTDTGSNPQFTAYSISIDNQSTGGDPMFGPQMGAAFFDGATQKIGTSVVVGPQTTYFDSNFGSGTTYIGDRITIYDSEINGYAEKASITIDNLVIDLAATNVTAPTATITAASLSSDTGALGNDWVTRTANQTISGSLSAALGSLDKVQVSYDNGATWSDATTQPGTGSTSWSTTTTLSGANTFQARVYNIVGNGTAYSHTYDTTSTAVPTVDVLTTSTTTPLLTGYAPLGAGETLTVSVGGATYNVTPYNDDYWSLDLSVAAPASGVLSLAASNTYSVTAVTHETGGGTRTDTTSSELTVSSGTTFSFETALTGSVNNTGKTLTETIAGETLQVVTVSDNLYDAINYGGLISGTDSVFLGGNNYETSTTFSLASGKTFDLLSMAVMDNDANVETLVFTSSKGSVSCSPTAYINNATAPSICNIASNANAANFQGITSFTVTTSTNTPANGGNVYYASVDNVALTSIGGMAPTTTVASASLSADTGTSNTDWITGTASQTISGTLSANLVAGESVQVSYDNGSTWSNAGTFSAGSNTWSTTTTLSGNNTFQARVTNASGSSTAFSHAYVLGTAPGAPTIGTATAGTAQATVTFSAPASDGGAAITGYTVTSSPGGLFASGAASPLTVSGLTNGTSYTFTVTATNAIGTGAASAASNSVTPKAAQTITFNNPGAQNFGTTPTLSASASSGLTVSFTSSTTGVCTITTGGALTFVTAGPCTINADQAGNGSYLAASTVSQSFSVNAVVPGAPTIGTATAGDTQASVTFSAPASNGGAAITSYTATASPGGATGSCAASPCTVTGLTNGTAYTFTITAANSAGTGLASSASNSVTPKAAQTITFTNPGTQNFGTTPTLTATSDSGLTVSFSSSTTGVCTITTGGALTFVTTGPCTINADQAGNGSFLAAATVSRSFSVSAVVPGAPTIGTASPGDTQATVTFTAPAFTGGASITGYTVTSTPGGLTGTGAASPITVTGLTNGIAYTFTVTATNSAGTGVASAASNSVTPNPGPAVVSVAVPAIGSYNVGQNLDFTVTWDQNTTVNGTPQIALVIGATTVQASYVSSPTATTSLFRYTVLAGQSDSNGITVGALTLNGGTIRNSSGVDATLTLNSVASTAAVLVNTAVPGTPTGPTATAGNAQATVTFTAPAYGGSSAITLYTATANPGGQTGTCAGPAACAITVSGLTNGTVYTFTVTASNASGTGAASAASNSVTPVSVGACGSANGLATAFMPTVNLCATGTPSAVTVGSPWTWTCAGSGGSNASCSAPNETIPTNTGSGHAIISGGTWVVDQAQSAGFIATSGDPSGKSPPSLPPGYTFPHGLFDFVLNGGVNGTAATITITYPTPLPAGSVYWKYGPSPAGYNCSGAACALPHWYQMPPAQAVFSGNTVTLTITDGGVGDDDFALGPNGIIVDQGGPGVPAVTGIPTLSQWGMVLLSGLLALGSLVTLRRKRL